MEMYWCQRELSSVELVASSREMVTKNAAVLGTQGQGILAGNGQESRVTKGGDCQGGGGVEGYNVWGYCILK